jgi:hypothetical protein
MCERARARAPTDQRPWQYFHRAPQLRGGGRELVGAVPPGSQGPGVPGRFFSSRALSTRRAALLPGCARAAPLGPRPQWLVGIVYVILLFRIVRSPRRGCSGAQVAEPPLGTPARRCPSPAQSRLLYGESERERERATSTDTPLLSHCCQFPLPLPNSGRLLAPSVSL